MAGIYFITDKEFGKFRATPGLLAALDQEFSKEDGYDGYPEPTAGFDLWQLLVEDDPIVRPNTIYMVLDNPPSQELLEVIKEALRQKVFVSFWYQEEKSGYFLRLGGVEDDQFVFYTR